MPPEDYVNLVLKEIRQRHQEVPSKKVSTLYFGGGTPSLLHPKLILAIMTELANVGFDFNSLQETTIEINPATIDQEKIEAYKSMGINRYSVGAQSFNDRLLTVCGRKHNADDTRRTLNLLKKHNLEFSFDLLFALPGQKLSDVAEDLKEALDFGTRHMSLYCLTVPEGHPMSFGRAPEGEQIDMFDLIDRNLVSSGFRKYEVSNYALPGYESRHNQTYWNDGSYWGLGLSAHSYFNSPEWGVRFWNPKSFDLYAQQLEVGVSAPPEALPENQKEFLSMEESMTDFCHMAFRQPQGLSKDAAQKKFGPHYDSLLLPQLNRLKNDGKMQETQSHWQISAEQERLLNQILLELCF